MKFDLIVIGGGPAGMNAALYSARAGLNTAIIEGGLFGGQMNNTELIENYIGLNEVYGEELSEKMYEHMIEFVPESNIIEEYVKSIKNEDKIFFVTLNNGNVIEGKSVILATGSTPRKLLTKGEERLANMGVSYCGVCDGSFFRGKDIFVVGGGNSALEEALYLSNLAKTVTVIHRRNEFRAEQIYIDRAKKIENISFVLDSNVTEIIGDEKVNSLEVTTNSGEKLILDGEGVFIKIGLRAVSPSVDYYKSLSYDEEGFIEVDNSLNPGIPGLFIAGDLIKKEHRQIATAVADGVLSALNAYSYLQNM